MRYWHAGEAGLKRLVRHDRADGSVLLHRYDRFGRRLASYAARVALAELQPDELTAPERHPQRYHITRYQRDTAGRLTVTDAAGLIQRHAWSPLGLLAAHTDADGATDPADCPIRLPGQFFDAETGLHYNRHRYYDPHAGRYVTQDPIGLYGGPNSYIYPVNPGDDIDPLGLQATGGRRNPRNGRWQPNGPKKPIPDPTKTENPTEIMKGKNDTASDIPDALRGVACIFNSEYCIPSDSFQCNRAEKKLSDGSKHIIDYLDNSVPALKDPGELYPPMASQLPNGYVCTEIGIRTHLPYRTTPPGL